jgi:hypothetical protein
VRSAKCCCSPTYWKASRQQLKHDFLNIRGQTPACSKSERSLPVLCFNTQELMWTNVIGHSTSIDCEHLNCDVPVQHPRKTDRGTLNPTLCQPLQGELALQEAGPLKGCQHPKVKSRTLTPCALKMYGLSTRRRSRNHLKTWGKPRLRHLERNSRR